MLAKLFRSKTTDSLQDLDDTRAAIATTKARLTALVSLPVPLEEADARIDRYFAERAAEYRPEVGAFLRPDLPPQHVDVVDYKQEQAVWAAFLGPQLAADWKARLRTHLGTAETITAAERDGAATRGESACTARAEEREERIICAAELAGLDIDRRADADPDVVLGTQLADVAA